MDTSLIYIVLTGLAFATALNLFLILRLAHIVLPPEEPKILVPLVGRAAPRFEAWRQTDGQRIASDDLAGRPVILVFLSPGCPSCREKTSQLIEILPATEKAGVALWIIGTDDTHDIAVLIRNSPLAARTLKMDATARKAFNPLGAAPLYIFIDDAMIVQAGSYLGDENWRTFVRQMREITAEMTG